MVYNYSVVPGQSFKLNTPGNHSFDDIIKNIKSDGQIIINHSKYPNGFEIKATQLANKIIFTTNMELVQNDDGSYSIKE